VPFVGPERLAGWEAAGAVPVWFYLISAAIFIAKTLAFVFVVVWIRWTLPRIRVDQMMSLCWKYLVPAGIVLVLLAAVTEWGSFEVFGEAAKGHAATTSPRGLLHVGFFAVAGLVPFVLFIAKTFRNIRYTGDKVDLTNW
jgi:NADH-quinone oxidoreductase subunit H